MDKRIRQLAEKLSAISSGKEQSITSEQLALELKASLEKEETLLLAVKEKDDKLKKIVKDRPTWSETIDDIL